MKRQLSGPRNSATVMSATPSPSQSGTILPALARVPNPPSGLLTLTPKKTVDGSAGQPSAAGRKVTLAITCVGLTKVTALTPTDGPKSALAPFWKFVPLMMTSTVLCSRNVCVLIVVTVGGLAARERSTTLSRKVVSGVGPVQYSPRMMRLTALARTVSICSCVAGVRMPPCRYSQPCATVKLIS